MTTVRKRTLKTAAILSWLVSSGCGGGTGTGGGEHLVERTGLAMGTELRLTAWTADDRAAGRVFDEVFAEFERLESLMSNWREGSDVLRLNAAAGDRPVRVSPEVREGILGVEKSALNDAGLVKPWMIRSPLYAVRARLARTGGGDDV